MCFIREKCKQFENFCGQGLCNCCVSTADALNTESRSLDDRVQFECVEKSKSPLIAFDDAKVRRRDSAIYMF